VQNLKTFQEQTAALAAANLAPREKSAVKKPEARKEDNKDLMT